LARPPQSSRPTRSGAVTIEGVGHYPMLEKPDEFNRKLRDVLKEFATKK
jgi:pimeloyl-ACP methyl ester carboxylesterase